MRKGIVVASIVSAWAETVTFATWNVLSIPKCSQKANGFPYFEETALKLHNSLSCGGKEYVFDIGTKKALDEDVGGLASCHGTWISGQVETLFAKENIDILVVQEIDYFHFKGIQRIIGDGRKFEMTPLQSKPLKDVGKDLENSLDNPKNPIPSDLPFVIWDKNKISEIKCFAGKGWPKGVAECAYTTQSQSKGGFIGMHAGGNEGFNVEEAKLIGRRPNIDVVLGDFNLHTVATVTAAVQTIEPFLKVAMPAEERSATVYRFVHPARKLFQAFDNDWRKGLNEKTGEPTIEFKCDNVLKNTFAYTKMKFNGTKTVEDVDKDGKPQTGYEVPQSLKVFELKDKSVKTYIEMCKALKQLKASTTSTEANKPPKEDKLVKELKDLDKIGNTGIDYTFDWTKFPQALGLKADLVMTQEAARYVSMDVKQEDFIAYNRYRFKKPSAPVIVKEDVLMPMADKNRDMEKDKKDSSVMKHFPIEDMASDHLPVVLHLELQKAKTFEDLIIPPKREATPAQKTTRRKALEKILAEEVPRTKAKKILEQYDNGQLDYRQALRAGRLAHKKALKEKTCWQIIKGWFTTAEKASTRRKLGDMAPTMGKLLKALKRVSQRMRRGERAA